MNEIRTNGYLGIFAKNFVLKGENLMGNGKERDYLGVYAVQTGHH